MSSKRIEFTRTNWTVTLSWSVQTYTLGRHHPLLEFQLSPILNKGFSKPALWFFISTILHRYEFSLDSNGGELIWICFSPETQFFQGFGQQSLSICFQSSTTSWESQYHHYLTMILYWLQDPGHLTIFPGIVFRFSAWRNLSPNQWKWSHEHLASLQALPISVDRCYWSVSTRSCLQILSTLSWCPSIFGWTTIFSCTWSCP